jgi:hypothetical protein
MPAGHLEVMPGSKVGDPHPLSPFGEGDDVLVLFHSPMLGADGSDRPFTFSHGWPVAISYAIPEDISGFFLLVWYDHIIWFRSSFAVRPGSSTDVPGGMAVPQAK